MVLGAGGTLVADGTLGTDWTRGADGTLGAGGTIGTDGTLGADGTRGRNLRFLSLNPSSDVFKAFTAMTKLFIRIIIVL